MLALELQNIKKVYHHQTCLNDINLKIEGGTFAVIFGPPGCGKSVILRLIAGLEKPSSGKVYIRGEDVTDTPSGERYLGYVPQSFALYPHYNVYKNIAYPLRLMKSHRATIDSVVRQTAKMLRIDPLLKKYPDQLSGGEKQRVALARGITKKTEIYVFDDPLSGLDFKLREQLIDDLKQMQQSLGATFIYTTSDPLETLMLAEQVHILDDGEIIESGSLEEVYGNPMHLRSMELLGFPKTNILPGKIFCRGNQVWCKTEIFEFPVKLSYRPELPENEEDVNIGVQPHKIKIGWGEISGLIKIRGRIVLREDLGGELIIHLDAGETRLLSVVRQDEAHLLSDDEVNLGVISSTMVLFSQLDGLRIGKGVD